MENKPCPMHQVHGILILAVSLATGTPAEGVPDSSGPIRVSSGRRVRGLAKQPYHECLCNGRRHYNAYALSRSASGLPGSFKIGSIQNS
jgi:hypothetical protein